MSGDFVPHVRMLSTGYEDVQTACLFGMPYVTTRKPLPFDTTLLNYNWQIWGTKAFSIYAGQTSHIEHQAVTQTTDAILRFMKKTKIIKYRIQNAGYESVVFDESELINVKARRAGIFYRVANVGDHVKEGATLAHILDPYDSSVIEEVKSPADGTIFFMHNRPLTLEHSILFRIQKLDC